MAKITRLSDPNNPYHKKNVVTASNANMKPAVVTKPTPAVPKTPTAARSTIARTRNFVDGLADSVVSAGRNKMKTANAEYNAIRKKKIDDAVDGKPRK